METSSTEMLQTLQAGAHWHSAGIATVANASSPGVMRYALVISILTPETDIVLGNEAAHQIGVPDANQS